jgi:hypothetical protein
VTPEERHARDEAGRALADLPPHQWAVLFEFGRETYRREAETRQEQ